MPDERSSSAAIGGGAGLLVAAALALVALHSALDWLGHLPLALQSVTDVPLTRAVLLTALATAALSVLGGAAFAVMCVRATRATLASRVSYVVLAADDFDPSEDAVLRAAAQLGRVRRAVLGWLDPRASAVRVRLDSGPDGRMVYRVEVARRARSVVQAAFGSLGNVELREEPDPPAPPAPKHVARAELVLARPSSEPLALVGLAPDPLQLFANAFAPVRERQGESASVVLDLLPAAASQRRRQPAPPAARPAPGPGQGLRAGRPERPRGPAHGGPVPQPEPAGRAAARVPVRTGGAEGRGAAARHQGAGARSAVPAPASGQDRR
ncbi:MAG TPA: hypothetical protein VLW53_04290 [Candidatus Eisenbacteria bacterium]|nr:hypothetical protein [Candidatus Eisenbacteria bacterium]